MKHKVMTTIFALVLVAGLSASVWAASDKREDRHEDGDRNRQINDELITLAAGVYQPVASGQGPSNNLGLTQDLSSIVFTKVNIYPVSGLPGDWHSSHAIGTFYLGGGYAVYDLPGGSILAQFVGSDFTKVPAPTPATNGFVSYTLDGTFKLNILEATGIYAPFADGHIHMVDTMKFIKVGADRWVGDFLEECFCHIHLKIEAPE